jgi:hypothetical protein
MLAKLPATEVKVDAFALEGGLDLHTPQLSLKPGRARGQTVNYECSISGGYTRIPGYERFDGRPSPSAAGYTAFEVSTVAGLAVGNTVNGQTSGATGVVAAIDGLLLVLTKVTGTWAVENVRIVTTVVAAVTNLSPTGITNAKAATYQLAAANIYRADIAAVPGSGEILGLFEFGGTVYAFRNNGGGTAAALYKSSSSGWTAVNLQYELGFTAGSGTAPAEGATVSKGGVSATVLRVVLESGSFGASNAAGRLIINAPTGGSFSAGAFTGGITATCSGAQAAIALAPSGEYEFRVGDVGNGQRVYGCDGANRAFEFDGAVFVPIKTGMTLDTPAHLALHKKHLFLSFKGSVQHSSLGLPYQWSPLLGASEISMGEDVTGFLSMPGNQDAGALAIATTGTVHILYGSSSTDWSQPTTLDNGTGAYARTMQYVGQAMYFNDRGLVSLTTAQAFGNFDSASLTLNLRSFWQTRRQLTTCSVLNREKSQMRVFFSDGWALFATVANRKMLGAMPVQFPNPASCAWNAAPANGAESSYFGSTNGFVYKMDVGTSFDGAAINHLLELSFANQGSSRVRKRYRGASLEMQGEGYAEFSFGYWLSYASEDVDQPSLVDASSTTKPAYWDAFTWDEFTWDGRSIAPAEIEMDGTAENVSLAISGNSALWPAFTINSAILHYTPRRLMRRGS